MTLDDEPVACKILRGQLSESRKALAALKREVLLTRRLRHPSILAVYTFWETDAARFLTMEYIEGTSLADALIDRGRPFTVPEISPWLGELSAALDYAHDQGVLHRDVKPANILLSEDGHVFLADFGIASLVLDPDTADLEYKAEGTVFFMCPERLSGAPAEPRGDLYSLAASVYHLLNGAPPFHAGDIIAQIQIRAPEPVAHLSEDANSVLLQALSKSPEHRPPSCAAFCEAFLDAASDAPRSMSPASLVDLGDADRSTVVLGDFDTGSRRTRLGKLLLKERVVTQEQLADALLDQQETGDKLGAVLIRLGFTNEERIASTLSTQLQIPLARLTEETPEDSVIALMDRQAAEAAMAVPVRRSSYGVLVAMADPMDMEAINRLESLFSDNVDPLMALESDVRGAIDRLYPV